MIEHKDKDDLNDNNNLSLYFRSKSTIVAAPLQNCSDLMKFHFKIEHF